MHCRKFFRVFLRHPLRYPVVGAAAGQNRAEYRNVPGFIAAPIDARLCSLADLNSRGTNGDPLLDLGDVCDLNEILIVRAENERRARLRMDAEQRQRRR